ncbi:MAG: efflux RND transporter permease subunit [Gammaproteobacteria bacterium]|nr:efflux RND transporter permease subunit [Gammaproteobacteria bacterium]
MSDFNLSAWAVRERGVTLFLIAAIVVAGTYAFFNLGRAEDPSFSVKIMTIATVWPGATAEEMQNLVAEPLEKRMQELRWYDWTETFTRPGLAFMTVSLKDSTPPSAVAGELYQARKKLGDEAAKLPRGVVGPLIDDEYGDVTFVLYALKAKGVPHRVLVREAEQLRQRLLHVAGVKKVKIIGERPERIYIDFSYERLATLGISPREVFGALNNRNVLTPAGSIDTRSPQVFMRLDGALDDIDKIRDTPIVAKGRILKLSDVAEVKHGYEDPATFLIRNGGEQTLMLGVVMQDRYNGLLLGENLEKEHAAITAEMPLGLSLTKVTDQSVNIEEAYGEFMLKFLVALLVVIAVSLVSMGWRVGLVVAAAVPLTLASVFVIMLATGRDFDRITLGALILSLGLLVDDAIIVIEAMVVRMEEGLDRIAAVTHAWSHTAAPMLSGTLVTAIGLMPVAFAKSGAGEYAGNIFWVVSFSLLASWVVAVAFTPYLGVKLLPAIRRVEGGHEAIYGTPRYRRLRAWIVKAVTHRKKVALTVLATLVVSVLGIGLAKQQFFPTSDRPEVLIEVQMPEGSSIEATSAAVEKVEAWLDEQPEAQVVTSYIGQGAPRFYLAIHPELPDPSFAKIVVLTPNAASREALLHRVRQSAADGLVPEARIRPTRIVFGPPSLFPVAFRVMGPEEATVRAIAEDVLGVMKQMPALRQVNTDWGERVPTVHFVLDQDRLRAIGLSSRDVGEQMQFLLNGIPVTQIRENIRSVDVIARSGGPNRLDPAKLAAFTLIGVEGQRVPFDQIGRTEVRMENPVMRRRDRYPTITVRGDVGDEFQPPEVSLQVLEKIAPIIENLPAGYKIETGSALEEAGKANTELAKVVPVMLILMMVVIIFQVRSLAAMAMVLMTAPLGVVGVVPTLLIFNQPFGFNAIIGLIGLAGIIMRNTLILIGQINENERAGLAIFDAVVEATVQRARPVVLTALAAVLAFVPLTFSAFWGSMAFTLIGGTIGGTALTLLFLPPLYAICVGIKPAIERSPNG